MFYIIECMPNMFPSTNVTNNTIPMVNKIREKNSVAPIIFVELFVSSTSLLNNNEKNEFLKKFNFSIDDFRIDMANKNRTNINLLIHDLTLYLENY